MAVSVRGAFDPYLTQVTPVLKTCCKTMQKITNLQLILQPQEHIIHVKTMVTIIDFPFIIVQTVITEPRKFRPSGEITTTEGLLALELAASYTGKLTHVLFTYFQAQGYLKKGADQTSKIKRLWELKTGIDGFLAVVDKIIHYYTCQSVGLPLDVDSLPKLQELEQQKENICAVIEHLDLIELHSTFANFKDEFRTSDASILCALLGLSNEYQNYLENLNTKQRNHRNDLYYIVRLLEERENDIKYDRNDKGTAGLFKNLVSLGFTRKCAEAIAKNIPPELIDIQKPLYWAERYLENIFVYHPLLSDNSRYPYSETTTDCFFKVNILTDKRKEPNSDVLSFNINMLNCTSESSENTKLVEDYLKKVQEEDKDSVLLYHGTTHDNADNILIWGITIGYGKCDQDFSNCNGFYLSEKLKDANKWSRAARGQRNAILVFNIKKDLIDASKENGLDLTKDKEKWQTIVKLYRNQSNNQEVQKDLLKDIKFIKGHMCLNPIDVAHGEDDPEGFGQSEIQICIMDNVYAVKFGSLENICCAIFY